MQNIRRSHKPPVAATCSRRLSLLLAVLLTALCVARPARAQICTDCTCEVSEDAITEDFIDDEEQATQDQMDAEFDATENWMINTLFLKNLLPWWENMTQQIATVGMQQAFIFGTLLDAKEELEVQRLFQQLTARAHKDYQPSLGVCTFGTNIRSVSATERLGELNAFALDQWGEGRNTNARDNSATEGEVSDIPSRLAQMRARYCDQHDDNNGLSLLCTTQAPAASVDRDIDYGGVIEHALTLNLDLGNVDTTVTHPTDDEQDVVALGNNIYGSDAISPVPEYAFLVNDNQQVMLDQRSVAAERSVAAASYYTIAGMKAMGTPLTANNPDPPANPANGTQLTTSADTVKYMNVILQELGVAAADIPNMLGTRPSYYAQMELLTKKIYQNPSFYTDLYDTPANVQRKKVALQAIGLMQNFDTLQSYLRTEMMLSQLLELEVIKLQESVQAKIDRLGVNGARSGK